MAVYEVPSYLIEENLATCILQFGDILPVSEKSMCGEWMSDMINSKAFFFAKWLDLEGRRLLVIVTGKKLACWHWGEIGYLSANCLGKKAPGKAPD